ncbi:hypothetical protein GIB67_027742 [Kingdonia uniflora]|uniref:GATA transcription factor n=1 Tax=Kingdonia uniflora TaxID=39325 RepID=A0A7J7PCC6_9MAGN|nr:hypothetical protein GIB67_027742 [Kingdonia uniflora]
MSEDLKDTLPNNEAKDVGPNYFGCYTREIEELFSQKDDIMSPLSVTRTGSSPLFSNGIGDRLSDLKRERLKGSLEQSVTTLRQEVDEMVDPVSAMYRIQTRLRDKDRVASNPNAFDGNLSEYPCKKQKMSSSTSVPKKPCSLSSQTCEKTSGLEDKNSKSLAAFSPDQSHLNNVEKSCSNCKTTRTPQWRIGPDGLRSLCNACGIRRTKGRLSPLGFSEIEKEKEREAEDTSSKSVDAASLNKSPLNNVKKSCSNCNTTKTPQWRVGPDGLKSLCNACGIRRKKETSSSLGFSEIEKEKERENSLSEDRNNKNLDAVSHKSQVDEDLETILECGGPQAEEVVKKYSDELSAKLDHMEEQLEGFLDLVVSKGRNMTLAEKQQLKKLIQSLPQKNLERVAEIVQRKKPHGAEDHPSDEIHIDMENEDNGTLWRLYYYVQAYKNATNPSEAKSKI